MGDFEEKLDSILNNPQAMSQIMSLARSLESSGAAQNPKAPSEPSKQAEDSVPLIDPGMLSGIAALFKQYNQSDDQRVALLNALRPFVKEQRYAKIDKAIQIAKLSRMARMAIELLRPKEGSDV